MKNLPLIILGIIILLIIVFVVRRASGNDATENPNNNNQVSLVTGCYVAQLAQDVYTMNIQQQNGDTVSGTLEFNNFQKDSSKGTLSGTYKNGILLGDYSFQSEGMNSVMQVIFKRTGTDFVRGYGPMNETGDRFADLNAITYDNSQIFRATPCGTSSTSEVMGKLPAGSSPVANAEAIQSQTWVWQKTVTGDGAVVTPSKSGAFTLVLGSDGKATGKTDCNSYFASYRIGTDGVINFQDIGSTKMFCEDSQEVVFTGALARARNYSINENGDLVFTLSPNAGTMILSKL